MLRRLLCIALLLWLPFGAAAALVVSGELRGAVSPASAAYFDRLLDQARLREADLVVLALDTPGGLDTAMRQMIQRILASPVPVAVFVHPSGARAASAGMYLLYAAHIAAMAPGTNLGAATPVALGGGRGGERPAAEDPPGARRGKPSPSAMEAKAVQDAAAYVRSLAELRGRNADWAEKAVRDADSLSAGAAEKAKVIDLVAADLPELLRRIDGRTVAMGGGQTRRLALADAAVVRLEPNWKESLLARIADPNIALILLMAGVYGLLFELYSPGLALPGVLGGICLLLAFYGLALLPVNWVGVALALLGVALMVTEMFMPSFGVLGIGGVVAFIAGGLMLVDPDVTGVAVSWELLVPFALLSGLGAVAVGVFALRARRRPPVSGREAMLGATARALADIDGEGWVWAFGERWRARSARPLAKGGRARVIAVDGLTLVVEPLEEGEAK